jgi:hypothetical protein
MGYAAKRARLSSALSTGNSLCVCAKSQLNSALRPAGRFRAAWPSPVHLRLFARWRFKPPHGQEYAVPRDGEREGEVGRDWVPRD